MNRYALLVLIFCCAVLLTATTAEAQFFFTGPAGGDFFDEANWNDASDGTGASPVGDPITDSTTNAIALDLVIDGDTVVAAGQVDFGTGSLTLGAGSALDITGAGNDLDINASSTFSLTDATLTVNDIINFEGNSSFSGGFVISVTDDIAFQDNFTNLTIDGTSFSSFDNTYFDGPTPGSISNATFTITDTFGIRNSISLVMTDTDIVVNASGGTSGGDVQNVFSGDAVGSSLTLLGASTLRADAIEEGADLILGGTSTATLGVHFTERIVDEGATITLDTMGASLVVVALDGADPDFVDARPFLINGITGVDYATDSSSWNITNWNGTDAVTLQIVPEPSGMVLTLLCLATSAIRRRRC